MHIDNVICSSQIIKSNPVIQDTAENRTRYLMALKHYIKKSGLSNRKIVKSQMAIYNDLLYDSNVNVKSDTKLAGNYNYLILFDFVFVTAFDVSSEKIISVLKCIIKETHLENFLFQNIISYCSGNLKAWEKIKKSKSYELFPDYLNVFKKNFEFIMQKKFTILITATMSAGKSTLINALCGRNVTLSQNMACTRQLHSIIGKPVDDGYVCESDYTLTLDADETKLLNDNEKNKTGRIKVSTYFRGNLSGKAVILNDTPGVNSSQNSDHRDISNNIIRKKKYDLIIYVLNATQLGTNDDEEHLMFVKKNIGNKPIIFILNKIDKFNSEDDDAIQIIEKHREYLRRLGYINPILCPLSSRYALLAKRSKYDELSRLESRELDRAMMDFEDLNYSKYYNEHFSDIGVCNTENEMDTFLINCGIEYVEKIICNYIAKKENKNG